MFSSGHAVGFFQRTRNWVLNQPIRSTGDDRKVVAVHGSGEYRAAEKHGAGNTLVISILTYHGMIGWLHAACRCVMALLTKAVMITGGT